MKDAKSCQWLLDGVATLDQQVQARALAYQQQLTKPPGALGRLEHLAVTLAAMQGELKPRLERIGISVFAADHGVADEAVSAFPQVVTTEMIANFSRGGAAISVLARRCNAHFEVVNLGTVVDAGELPGVVDARIAAATANFCHQPAMTPVQLERALAAGAEAVERALQQRAQLFIGGEMGIANSTSAAALAAAYLALPATVLAGPGTGVDAAGVEHKARVITQALSRHQAQLHEPLQILRCLGGFEIAALSGAYIRCAQSGLPALVDGFISTVAALAAVRINPGCRDWLLFSHNSAEPGHQQVLAALDAEPLVNLQMRLGEGSGAALVLPLLQAACALHGEMATFAEAGVSDKE